MALELAADQSVLDTWNTDGAAGNVEYIERMEYMFEQKSISFMLKKVKSKFVASYYVRQKSIVVRADFFSETEPDRERKSEFYAIAKNVAVK